MKVGELREKLDKLKKEEIIKLAVEFYKLVPKAKKEDYSLDDLINNPSEKKVKATKAKVGLPEVEAEVTTFVEHVRAGYYYEYNKIVPKKERSTWRFKVKRLYKALINKNIQEGNLQVQSDLLTQLYVLMCEAAGYYHFSTTDPFQSIKVTQVEFYKTVLTFIGEAEGKMALVEKGIDLIIQNDLDRETFYSELMSELVEALDIPNLKYEAIEKARKLTAKNGFLPSAKKKEKIVFSSSGDDFYQSERHNNYTELVFMLYMSLYEHEEAIQYYQTHHYEYNEEVKLYILISILFRYQKPDLIRREIETAIEQGIKPRQNLLSLLKHIKENDKLPKYMR